MKNKNLANVIAYYLMVELEPNERVEMHNLSVSDLILVYSVSAHSLFSSLPVSTVNRKSKRKPN